MPIIRKFLQILQIQNGFWRLAISGWLLALNFVIDLSEMSSESSVADVSVASEAQASAREKMGAEAHRIRQSSVKYITIYRVVSSLSSMAARHFTFFMAAVAAALTLAAW